jgi:AraC-like DNA-binding protein
MTDTLSDVLRAVRLSGAVFFTIDASGPWVVETPHGREIGPYLVPGAEHVIDYHVISKGRCWGGILDEPQIELIAGDVIAFPHGDPHVLSSAPNMRNAPSLDTYRNVRQQPLPIAISMLRGGDDQAQVICGFLGCDARPFNPLLASLPRMIHLRGDSGVQRLVELALAESTRPSPGGQAVLSRLSEIMFVEVVRRHVATLPAGQTGWFAGLRDDGIGRALHKLHDAPTHPWTLDGLARDVGLSRSILAERFTELVGIPPIQYLAQWRIQLAASLLRTTTASLAEIAKQVGYGSEAALSRAFKRWVGVAPAHYRREPLPA